MAFFLFIVLALTAGSWLDAQERPVPKDSARISIPGCAKGRTFIVAARSEAEPVRSGVQPGTRFRLSADKKILEQINLLLPGPRCWTGCRSFGPQSYHRIDPRRPPRGHEAR